MTQPQIQTVKRTSAEVECEWKLSGVSEEWIPASDHDALEQRVDLIASQANRLNDENNALRESLRELEGRNAELIGKLHLVSDLAEDAKAHRWPAADAIDEILKVAALRALRERVAPTPPPS